MDCAAVLDYPRPGMHFLVGKFLMLSSRLLDINDRVTRSASLVTGQEDSAKMSPNLVASERGSGSQ